MLQSLNKILIEKWFELFQNGNRPSHINYLGIRSNVGDGYSIFLGFVDNHHFPCLKIKISRDPVSIAKLQNEWKILHKLKYSNSFLLSDSIPLPLLKEEIDNKLVTITSAPQGSPMLPKLKDCKTHFLTITKWLTQLGTTCQSPITKNTVQEKLVNVSEQLYKTFKFSHNQTTIYDGWMDQILGQGKAGKIILYTSHNNLYHVNIWLSNRKIMIDNWEWGDLISFPLHDLFNFITTYFLNLNRKKTLEDFLNSFHSTFFEENKQRNLIKHWVKNYCTSLEIPLENVEAYLGIFLGQRALREYNQLLRDADRGYLPLIKNTSGRKSFSDSMRNQLWINLLRIFMRKKNCFSPDVFASDVKCH